MRTRRGAKLVAASLLGLALSAATISVAAPAHGGTTLCPQHPPYHLRHNTWPPPHRVLAPPRQIRAINLCRYVAGPTGYSSLRLAGNYLVPDQKTKRQLVS